MGQNINRTEFSREDFSAFRDCLSTSLKAFQKLLDQPGFGEGPPSYGSELELYLIDQFARPNPINERVLEKARDESLTLELNRFNLEYNFTPLIDESTPFSMMTRQMHIALDGLTDIAAGEGARVLPIGILPTLKKSDMGRDAITDVERFHVLARALKQKRGENFKIDIRGIESVDLEWGDVSFEGANTSFQFHYRVSPREFANSYNAAQLTTPLALALGANSPFFLGHRLWRETRIALFKQSIDYRLDDDLSKHLPARVLFGLGWVRQGIHELFAEGAYLFEPLMPINSGVNPLSELERGSVPELSELRLHQGSIWTWNRPIYDPTDNGHLRIEFRALPAGPTPTNMAASAALMSGWMKGLAPYMPQLLPAIPFRYAEQNFYRAAKYGIDALLFWPNKKRGQLEERPVTDIVLEILPYAEAGLSQLNIDQLEIEKQLGIVRASLETKTNGARWQLEMFEKLCAQTDHDTALAELVERYYAQYKRKQPVHEWSLNV